MVKDTIYSLCSKYAPSYYGWSSETRTPRFMLQLIWAGSKRLSGARHHRKFLYQINYISDKPLDVEKDEMLNSLITDVEEKGYNTNDWQEQIDVDEKYNDAIYVYWLEVRNY